MGTDYQKIKDEVKKKIDEVYKDNKEKCNSRYELEKAIDDSLGSDMKKNIEDETINKFFNEHKKKILDDHSEYLMKKEKEKFDEKLSKMMKEKEKKEEQMMKENRELREKERKEQNEILQNLINENNKKIDIIREEAKRQQQRIYEERKEAEKQAKQMIENMQKQLKQERDEEKKKKLLEEEKKLKELNAKKAEVLKNFQKKLEIIKSNKIKDIIQNFKLNESKFCLDDITKFESQKIGNLIKNIFKGDMVLKQIITNLNFFVDKIKNKVRNVDHLNIILVGPSGVGKSTLIKSILESKNEIITGFGKPQTQEIEVHSSDIIPFLRLADSKGIEKNITSGVNAVYESIKQFIDNKLATKDPDQYIHCIWYCWTGSRLEPSEVEILQKLSKQYQSEVLPVIIVYTNAIYPDDTREAINYIKNDLKLDNEFIDILAKRRELRGKAAVEPFNLDKLRGRSIELAMSAINSSCYEGLSKEIKSLIGEFMDDLGKDLKQSIELEVEEIKSKFNEESKIEDLYKEIILIILDIFYKYIFLSTQSKVSNFEKLEVTFGKNKYPVSSNCQKFVKAFVIDYFKECLISYEKNLKIILEKYTKELCNEIMAFQLEFNQQNDYLLKFSWTSIELEKIMKNYIHDNFAKKAKLAALKNSLTFIVEPLINQFTLFFIQAYKKAMEKPEFKETISQIIKVPFDNLKRKVKQYNELLKPKKLEEVQPMAPTPENNVIDKPSAAPTMPTPTPQDLVNSQLDDMFNDINN